jgi:competence CoiA-like predicted nuclease
MIYAKGENGNKIKATKGAKATCLHCGEKLIAKCGIINMWHWSHSTKTECDLLKKEMTQWHIDWQEKFPEENREVKVLYKEGYRIADVKLNNGLVIEFQHSPIQNEVMWEREKAHENMIWILDHTDSYYRIYREGNGIYYMTLSSFKKNFAYSNKPVYINFQDDLLYCPKTFTILKVVDGKTEIVQEKDLPEDNYSYAKTLTPRECVHNVIMLEKKKSRVKKAIRQGDELIEALKDKDVFDWFVKQYRMDGFKSICKNNFKK